MFGIRVALPPLFAKGSLICFLFSSKLLMFKIFITNPFPLLLLIFGIGSIHSLRQDNYGCGEGEEVTDKPDEGAMHHLFSILLITYALELLVWPAVIANFLIRRLKRTALFGMRFVHGKGGRQERIEFSFGLALKALQYYNCNKKGGGEFTNNGELRGFASNMVSLLEFACLHLLLDGSSSNRFVFCNERWT